MKDVIYKEPLYATWRTMLQRCSNPNLECYPNYGGRGIAVCDRWELYPIGYRNFVADMGPKPTPKHTLDRLDNDLGYSPDNCRWATRREQLANRRNTSFVPGPDGVMRTTVSVAEEFGISQQVIYWRSKRGLSWAEIISKHHLEPGYSSIDEARNTYVANVTAKTHCKHGHEYTEENTVRDTRGNRYCRICSRAKFKRYYDKLKAAAQR